MREAAEMVRKIRALAAAPPPPGTAPLRCSVCKCGWEEGTYDLDCECRCHTDPTYKPTEPTPIVEVALDAALAEVRRQGGPEYLLREARNAGLAAAAVPAKDTPRDPLQHHVTCDVSTGAGPCDCGQAAPQDTPGGTPPSTRSLLDAVVDGRLSPEEAAKKMEPTPGGTGTAETENLNDGGLAWPIEKCQVDPFVMRHGRNWDPTGCKHPGTVLVKGRRYCQQHWENAKRLPARPPAAPSPSATPTTHEEPKP